MKYSKDVIDEIRTLIQVVVDEIDQKTKTLEELRKLIKELSEG